MNLDILHWLILVPATGGLVCYILSRQTAVLSRAVAVLSMVISTALALTVLAKPLPYSSAAYSWLDVGGFELSIDLTANQFTVWMVPAAMLFGLLVVIYSLSYCAERMNEGRYYGFVLWSVAGAVCALLANNLLLLLISWEIVTVMLYLLVDLGSGETRKASAKSFAILGLSDCAMLLGIVMIWHEAGTLTMTEIAGSPIVVEGGMVAGFLLMVAAALAKAGAIPLHTWIPAAGEAAPTPVVALLPASLDKLLGIYLLAIVTLKLFDPATSPQWLRLLLMTIGAITILGAVGMAMIQHNLKKLLSFHAISQVGYMVLGIASGIPLAIVGGLFHMINNAVYKCCLFLGAGAVEHRTGTVEIERLGGLARAMPITFIAMSIAALSISGVPPFNGFASKWMVYQGMLSMESGVGMLFLAAAVFGSGLTLASFVKVIYGIFLGRRPAALSEWGVRRAPVTMLAPMALLAIVCVFFGVVAWWPTQMLLSPAMAELGQSAADVDAIVTWSAKTMSVATLLIVFGVAIGLLIVWIARTMKVRETDIFLGGQVHESEETRVPATDFYQTVRKLDGVQPVYDHAEKESFDAYNIAGTYGRGFVEALRSLHTGMLPLYVGWCALGLGAILAIVLVFR